MNHTRSPRWSILFFLCYYVWVCSGDDVFFCETLRNWEKNPDVTGSSSGIFWTVCRLVSADIRIKCTFLSVKLYHTIHRTTYKTEREAKSCKRKKRRIGYVICLPKLPQRMIR